ncbi:MAG: hypothetical protein COZ15_01705 [Elusimicrobia bacterium CG_4_10_14_3_um_filter_49_12_50_7]|nr:MAG: hypothetical protein COZ15_01705 [Elusimicrobia bacterium CG_4_10_14_3_um_filter_49_12_50_7]
MSWVSTLDATTARALPMSMEVSTLWGVLRNLFNARAAAGDPARIDCFWKGESEHIAVSAPAK